MLLSSTRAKILLTWFVPAQTSYLLQVEHAAECVQGLSSVDGHSTNDS